MNGAVLADRRARSPPARKLGFWPLVAATYFMVSGGPYGLEELVAQGYPLALLALVVTPWLWSVPTALMVGELASAIPESGGYYAWVRRALGPFWGFQEAWLSVAASVFDMAIYPTLFTLYLGRVVPGLGDGVGAFAVGVLLIAACAAWNLRGAASVGRGSIVFGALLLSPFVVLIVLAVAHPGAAAHAGVGPTMAEAGPSGVLGGVLVAMWNTMGWDNASPIANEVDRPERNYPRAILTTVGLVTLSYVAPILGVWIGGLDPTGWTTGAWVDAARAFGGRALAASVVAGGMLCGAGMFNALLLSYSRLPAVLAEEGYLPAWLAGGGRPAGRGEAISRRGGDDPTPRRSIVACSITYAICLGIDFRHLVALDVVLYGSSLLLEFVALVVLRVREPNLARPFRVPGGIVGGALLGVPPLVLLGAACVGTSDERVGPIPSLAIGALVIAAGPALYVLARGRARRAARLGP